VCAVVFAPQPNRSHPLIDQSGILSSAEMIGMIDSTRKGVVVNCSASLQSVLQRSVEPTAQSGQCRPRP
jgi:hypothetical protein